MARYTKDSQGRFIINGKTHEILIGTRYKTTGGLTKSHLLQNKSGRIVSVKKHSTAKKEKRLIKAGYGTKKGKFGFVKIGTKTKKRRGGTLVI
jgi:ribosomal protein S4